MKYLLITMLVCLSAIAGAQAPGIVWQHSYGGDHGHEVYGMCRTLDGGYIMTGSTDSSYGNADAVGDLNFWLLRVDSTGTMKWTKSLSSHGYDAGLCIIPTRDSGYMAVGYTSANDTGITVYEDISNYRIVKLNSLENVQWEVYYGGDHSDVAESVVQTADGGYIVAGACSSTGGNVTGNHGDNDYWIVKLDSSGGLEWQRSYGGRDHDDAYCIIQTADGGYAVAGCSYSHDGDVKGHHIFHSKQAKYATSDYWILKLDSRGAIAWQRSLGGSGDDIAKSIVQTPDGGYVIAGTSNSHDGDVKGNHGEDDYWIVKLSARGRIQWQRSLGGSGRDEATGIILTADSGYAVIGYSGSQDGDVTDNQGDTDYWVVKLNSKGTMQWQKSLGGGDKDRANAIVQNPDGSYTIAGHTMSMFDDSGTSYVQRVWLVKLAAK